jgi:hypothetical protein
MSYLEKDDPRVLLAQYKNGDDAESDILSDFENWVNDYMPNVDAEQSDFLSCAIKMYLLEDDKSQKAIARAEQQQLRDWISAVKGAENG